MKKEIKFLLKESGLTNYQISKETGIAQTVLGRYTSGNAEIDNMTLGNATKLYEYYLKLEGENQQLLKKEEEK